MRSDPLAKPALFPSKNLRPGFRASSRLGQNFLIDNNISRKIAAFAACDAADIVVELGAGTGALTCVLAPLVQRLIAVEIDRRLLETLRNNTAALGNVEIWHGDARSCDFGALGASAPLKVVGNIPYYASSEIIFNLFAQRAIIKNATLMLQKELAQRLCAAPGGKDYGIPTVILGMSADISKGFDVPPACFRPQPQVTSTVVRLDFLDRNRLELANEKYFQMVVRGLFAQRRKNSFNNLKNILNGDAVLAMALLQRAGIAPEARAETLSRQDFANLANLLAEI